MAPTAKVIKQVGDEFDGCWLIKNHGRAGIDFPVCFNGIEHRFFNGIESRTAADVVACATSVSHENQANLPGGVHVGIAYQAVGFTRMAEHLLTAAQNDILMGCIGDDVRAKPPAPEQAIIGVSIASIVQPLRSEHLGYGRRAQQPISVGLAFVEQGHEYFGQIIPGNPQPSLRRKPQSVRPLHIS